MPLGDFQAIDALWICLSVFLVVVGLALAYFLLRLGGSAARLAALLRGLEEKVPPVLDKVGGTVDRVNLQLDKVDLVTTSAVDAADAADTAVRAVSMAITRPVQKLSGLAKGISHGASALWAGHDVKAAVAAGREAASRREREIAEELALADRTAPYRRPPAAAPWDEPGEDPGLPGEKPAWMRAAEDLEEATEELRLPEAPAGG